MDDFMKAQNRDRGAVAGSGPISSSLAGMMHEIEQLTRDINEAVNVQNKEHERIQGLKDALSDMHDRFNNELSNFKLDITPNGTSWHKEVRDGTIAAATSPMIGQRRS